jgi:hypothetical protein
MHTIISSAITLESHLVWSESYSLSCTLSSPVLLPITLESYLLWYVLVSIVHQLYSVPACTIVSSMHY